MKKLLQKIFSILIGLTVALLIGEVILRIYNPLQNRVQGNEIQLLTNYNRKVELQNLEKGIELDSIFNYSTNNIGLRGQDYTDSTNSSFKIITVGGSTTECSKLDDNKTWSSILNSSLQNKNNNIWLNNAGIDGASTVGHQMLLDEHILQLKPSMIIFLVGINDMFLTKQKSITNFHKDSRENRLKKLSNYSELISFLWNSYRNLTTKEINAFHFKPDNLKSLKTETYNSDLKAHKTAQVEYEKRLIKLIQTCTLNQIEPVFITQPYLNKTKLHPYSFVDLYNQTTINTAKTHQLQCIRLDSLLPNNSKLYYDDMHYSIPGAKKVADITFEHLIIE